jgi:hypothetical protein
MREEKLELEVEVKPLNLKVDTETSAKGFIRREFE